MKKMAQMMAVLVIVVVGSMAMAADSGNPQITSPRVCKIIKADMEEYIRLAVQVQYIAGLEDQQVMLEKSINAMGHDPVDRSDLYVNERTKRVLRLVIAAREIISLCPKSEMLNNDKLDNLLQIELNKLALDVLDSRLGKCIDKKIVSNIIKNRCVDLKKREFPSQEILYN